ncbi:hypothetical protein AVEN_2708-1 [Araneus ventricosus]|uniref:Uncharacterized protein n=1 Tax=Araneus ventricosus TaxID=182803 RepID=A0A4Y2RJ79_ARAVE|nr:hypothetical protein AVEN_2708-1 [Araneus ventricosus]
MKLKQSFQNLADCGGGGRLIGKMSMIVSLAKVRGLEVDRNDIYQRVEEHNKDLNTEELTKLHCASQQEVMEESLSEKEEVTAKQQSSSAIREMLKSWETVASNIEKHHSNVVVVMRATNLFYDIFVIF